MALGGHGSRWKTVSFDLGGQAMVLIRQIRSRPSQKRHPGLKIVLLARQPLTHGRARSKKTLVRMAGADHLGTLPNVWFDLSALHIVREEEEYPFPSTKRYFDLARGIVG